MKFPLFITIIFSALCVSSLQADPADLVKACQNFKKTFLEACQLIDEDKRTHKMDFLKENLATGSSVIFYEIICDAIDDTVKLLSTQPGAKNKDLIDILKAFKNEIDSELMYDLNTGTVVKQEITRAGTTRFLHFPYDETHCYKIAHNLK
jgi:hypothetical protein